MKLIEFKIRRFKDLLTGILLDCGTKWSLIRYNAVDYVLDGYIFINKRYILYENEIGEGTIQHQILSLKSRTDYFHFNENTNILDDNNLLFSILKKEKELVAICLHCEDIIYVGRIKEVNLKSFALNTYDTELRQSGVMNLEFSKVRYIQIRTDYLNSLCLLLKQKDFSESSRQS